MTGLLVDADAILRARARSATRGLFDLILLVIIFGMTYGAVMGTFGGVSGGRSLQVLYSAIKVPILLLVSFGLSLPSFFVINTLLGMRGDFAQAMRALISAQAGLTIVLASLAPLTALWYVSSNDYESAVLFNGVLFAIASAAAQSILRKLYRPLIERHPRHRTLLRFWMVIYMLVAVQMAWVLRPFIGDPLSPTRFFRAGAWGNAWEVIARLVWQMFT